MPAVYAVFTMLVYWRLWTPIEGAQGSWRYDPRFEYWQDLIFQFRTLADGQLALWNPFDRAGFPLYGDPQPGMLYPPNWPLLAWGAVGGGIPFAAIAVKILAHWVFGAVGMHLFLRRLGAREPACYAAGLLFSFTSPKIRYGGSALNWSIAWIPWVLLAVDWFAEKPGARRGIVLGTTAAMVLLSGAPAVVLYTLLLAVPYLAYRMWGQLRASWKPLAIAAAVSVLWLAPLVASNLEQLPESVREARGLGFITDSVFSPAHLLGFVVPRLGGENPYVGALAVLAIAALLAGGGRGRTLLFVAIAAAGVLLSFGNNAGVLPAAASALPPFSLFRRAHRYLYVTTTALAILAGLGLAKLLALEAEERRRQLARALTWLGGALTFALGVAYVVGVAVRDDVGAVRNESFGLATAAAGLATWLARGVLLAPEGRRPLYAWALPLLVAIELWTANSKVVDIGMDPHPRTDSDDRLAELEGVADHRFRIYDQGLFDFRAGTRLGVRDFGGYEDDPLGLSRYKLFAGLAKRDPRLLGHANVRYLTTDGGKRRVRPPPDATERGRGVFELAQVAPAIYYVPSAEIATDPRQALAALRGIDPGEGAVVEGAAPPAGPADAAPTAGRFTTYEPNRIVAEIETPGPGLVVVSEAYFPRWRATVDGEEVDVQPANVLFRGIPVTSAGRHTIEMTLRPPRFWALLPAYLVALGLLGWSVVSLRRRR